MLNTPEHKFNPDGRAAILERLDRTLSKLSMAGQAGGRLGSQDAGGIAEKS